VLGAQYASHGPAQTICTAKTQRTQRKEKNIPFDGGTAQRSATPTSTLNRSDTVTNSAQDHPYCDASRRPAFQFFRKCLPCVLCVFAVKGLR
jgi:hypothetical protein